MIPWLQWMNRNTENLKLKSVETFIWNIFVAMSQNRTFTMLNNGTAKWIRAINDIKIPSNNWV